MTWRSKTTKMTTSHCFHPLTHLFAPLDYMSREAASVLGHTLLWLWSSFMCTFWMSLVCCSTCTTTTDPRISSEETGALRPQSARKGPLWPALPQLHGICMWRTTATVSAFLESRAYGYKDLIWVLRKISFCLMYVMVGLLSWIIHLAFPSSDNTMQTLRKELRNFSWFNAFVFWCEFVDVSQPYAGGSCSTGVPHPTQNTPHEDNQLETSDFW